MAVLALLFSLCPAQPCRACGFHASIFTGDFAVTWARLKPNLDPGMRQQIIHELLRILRFVDTYNYAPDSPVWMQTERGRAHARASAVAILHELGMHAAPLVWEALADDIRFSTKETARALDKVRAAQAQVASAWGEVRAEAEKVPEVARKLEEFERDSLRSQVLSHAIYEIFLKEGLLYQGTPQALPSRGHRPLPVERFTQVHAGGMQGQQALLALVQADPDLRGKAKVAEWLRKHGAAQQEHMKAVSAYDALVTRFKPELSGGDMTPSDEYRSDLQEVFIRIGDPTVALLKKWTRNSNKEVAATALKLAETIGNLKEPRAPVGVRPLLPQLQRIATTALDAWDFGDERPQSKVRVLALKRMQDRGVEACADLMALMELRPSGFQIEARSALAELAGVDHGLDLTAWQAWLARQLEAEKHKPLPPELATEDLSIGRSPNAPRSPDRPKRPVPPPEPPPETPPEAAMPVEELNRLLTPGESETKTPTVKPQGAAKSELQDEDADKGRYEK